MSQPSPWFDAHIDALAEASRLGPIVDLACGRGRHALACAERGWRVVGIDRSQASLTELRDAAAGRPGSSPALVQADLEAGNAIPLASGACGGVLVFRYLHRPLAQEIQRLLAPGGLLLYETFTLEQADLPAGPSRSAFLLEQGELPTLFPDLERLDYREERRSAPPIEEAVASLAARRRG